MRATNLKAKEGAVVEAVKKLEDLCISKYDGSPNQLDIAGVSTSPAAAVTGGFSYTVTVEAICRSGL